MSKSTGAVLLMIAVAIAAAARGVVWYADFDRLPEALIRGEALASSNQWGAAANQLDAYLAHHPDDLQAILARFGVAKELGQTQLALDLVGQFGPEHFMHPDILYRKGDLFRACNQLRKAESTWLECIEVASARQNVALAHQARSKLAELFSFQGRTEQSGKVLWDIYPDHPTPWRVLKGLLGLEFTQPRPKQAIEDLRRFIAADPDDYYSRRALGERLLQAGEQRAAFALLERCFGENQRDAKAWTLLLEATLELAEHNEAAALLSKMPATAEKDPKSWRLRAKLESARENSSEALRIAYEGARRHPYDRELTYLLAGLQQQAGKGMEAAESMARFGALKQANDSVFEAYSELALLDSNPATFPAAELCRRISEGCDRLGMARLAESWKKEELRLRPLSSTPGS